MAVGGDVFLLEMGEPVKIDELARLMIRLTGLEVKTDERPDGDIPIVYTGLRPGEKLFEELLIGVNPQGTEHPRIMRSDEPFLSTADLRCELDVLHGAMGLRDVESVHAVLMRTVEGYRPDPVLSEAAHPAVVFGAPSRTLH
jgi:FlaA1/EpsC-like NDP-sugar epimerase